MSLGGLPDEQVELAWEIVDEDGDGFLDRE